MLRFYDGYDGYDGYFLVLYVRVPLFLVQSFSIELPK